MIEIARNNNTQGVFQKDIAKSQSLSNKYLDHIIHGLKTSGLITNVKGKKSGYLLTGDAKNITVFDIHKALEPDLCLVECLSPNYQCERSNHCEAQGFWGGLNTVILNYLRSVTLDDLLNRPEIAGKIDL
jgi:Rrf2 family protein